MATREFLEELEDGQADADTNLLVILEAFSYFLLYIILIAAVFLQMFMIYFRY